MASSEDGRLGPRERLARTAGSALAGAIERTVQLFEALIARTAGGTAQFFEPAALPWVAPLEAQWPRMRGELDRLLRRVDLLPNFQDVQEEQRMLTDDDRWKVFLLYGYGVRLDENCRRCPETARLVESIPGMTTAMFSILRRGKHIPPHRGPYKGVLRYHLGLRVPAGCRIRVGDEVRHWAEGRSLVFDDTHEHEAWNDSDEDRVVLFVDVLRPLPEPLATLNRGMIALIRRTPFIRDAQRQQRRWEELFGTQLDAPAPTRPA
jgi:beta-hydroxylase